MHHLFPHHLSYILQAGYGYLSPAAVAKYSFIFTFFSLLFLMIYQGTVTIPSLLSGCNLLSSPWCTNVALALLLPLLLCIDHFIWRTYYLCTFLWIANIYFPILYANLVEPILNTSTLYGMRYYRIPTFRVYGIEIYNVLKMTPNAMFCLTISIPFLCGIYKVYEYIEPQKFIFFKIFVIMWHALIMNDIDSYYRWLPW